MGFLYLVAECNEDDDIQCGVLTMVNATGNRTVSQFFIHLSPNSWMKRSSAIVGM